MTGKITNDTLKQELLNMIKAYEINPKVKADNRKKRLISDNWKMHITLVLENETDPIKRCFLHGLYSALGHFEGNELTCEQFIDYARFLVSYCISLYFHWSAAQADKKIFCNRFTVNAF